MDNKVKVRDAVKVTQRRIEMLTLSIKLHREYADPEHIQQLLKPKEDELHRIQADIASLKSKHHQASTKIKGFQRDLRYEQKVMAKLKNAKLIAALKETAQELKEMTNAD